MSGVDAKFAAWKTAKRPFKAPAKKAAMGALKRIRASPFDSRPKTTPSATREDFDPIRGGSSASGFVDTEAKEAFQPSAKKAKALAVAVAAMTATQRAAYEAAIAGCSMFLTGSPGTGKTHVTKQMVRAFRLAGKRPVVLAPTGKAASHLSGVTIHKAYGLGPEHVKGQCTFSKWNVKRMVESLRDTKSALIIDEISMCSAKLLCTIHLLSAEYAGDATRPFGGLQVILIGDFRQLEPIRPRVTPQSCIRVKGESKQAYWRKVEKTMAEGRGTFDSGDFCFLAPVWGMMFPRIDPAAPPRTRHTMADIPPFELFVLTENMRNIDDPRFIALLSRARKGGAELTPEDCDLLLARVEGRGGNPTAPPGTVELHPRNAQVNDHNKRELAKIITPGNPLRRYMAQDEGAVNDAEMTSRGVPKALEIAVGARIIITRNSKGVVNGDCGWVISLADNAITVSLDRWNEEGIRGTAGGGGQRAPGIYSVERMSYEIKNPKTGDIIGSRSQFPVMMAWALTVHKAQGMTLSSVLIGLEGGDMFALGHGYVGFSRAKRLRDVWIRAPGGVKFADKLDRTFIQRQFMSSEEVGELEANGYTY